VTGLDTAILVVIGLSALLGAIRGMLTEVLSLLVWVAALWLTVAFGDVAAAEFTGIETPLLRALAGYGATFALVVVVGNIAVWLLRTLLHGAGLSGTDRMLGFGFGAARGYAIVLAVVLLVSFTPWSRATLWRESALMPVFTVPAGWIVAQLPDGSELVAFAAPALNALPSMASDGHAAMSDAADATGDAPSSALPPIAGLDIAHAAQWLGVMPQDGNPMLRQWAAQAGLGSPSGLPAAGDAARIAPGTTMSDDPARVGASPLDAPSGDPANTQNPNPESN
jgi:membrane protein required for colicin V production